MVSVNGYRERLKGYFNGCGGAFHRRRRRFFFAAARALSRHPRMNKLLVLRSTPQAHWCSALLIAAPASHAQ